MMFKKKIAKNKEVEKLKSHNKVPSQKQKLTITIPSSVPTEHPKKPNHLTPKYNITINEELFNEIKEDCTKNEKISEENKDRILNEGETIILKVKESRQSYTKPAYIVRGTENKYYIITIDTWGALLITNPKTSPGKSGQYFSGNRTDEGYLKYDQNSFKLSLIKDFLSPELLENFIENVKDENNNEKFPKITVTEQSSNGKLLRVFKYKTDSISALKRGKRYTWLRN